MSYKTRVDYGGNNRQLKQLQFSETTLSGKTTFGVDDVYIPENITGDTINIDALQNIKTRGLIFANPLSAITATTITILARNPTNGMVGEIPINKQKEIFSAYTLTPLDNNYTIWLSGTTGTVITVDDTLPDNFECSFYNDGAQDWVFSGGTATLYTPDGDTLGQDKVCTVIKKGNNNNHKLKGELT